MASVSDRAPLPLIQATCVLIGASAVLIRGEPGSGKSSLAAALIARDAPGFLVRLVADDAVRVLPAGGRLVALVPELTRGLVEMRGLGLVSTPHEPRAVVRLVVDLLPADAIERLPDSGASTATIAGVALPRVALPAGDAVTVDRLLAAVFCVADRGKSNRLLCNTARIRA